MIAAGVLVVIDILTILTILKLEPAVKPLLYFILECMGGTGALVLRSFRPPLGWSQGLLTWFGGTGVSMAINSLLGFGAGRDPFSTFIGSSVWAALFLYAGFKRPKSNKSQT